MKMARVMGIAESFSLNPPLSFISGIVMRRDFNIDGAAIANITVNGSDATDKIVDMYKKMHRNDISAMVINGCILSMYNIVEAERIKEQTSLPVVCIASREGKNLENTMALHNEINKIEAYRKLGRQSGIMLKTGYHIWVRVFGLNLSEAASLLNSYTINGKVPEPVRVAGLISSACLKNALNR